VDSAHRLRAIVRNTGSATWLASPEPGRGPIRVGSRWRAADGLETVHEDGRSPLPTSVPTGDECLVDLTATAPPRPGRYILEVDVVEEGVAWFGEVTGSQPARVQVQVGARWRLPTLSSLSTPPRRALVAAARGLHIDHRFVPVMEMHHLVRSEVESVIRDAGGEILDVTDDGRCGADLESRQFIVRRLPQAPR
jgi:hypothetical protein